MRRITCLTMVLAIAESVASCGGGGSMDATPPAFADPSIPIVSAAPGMPLKPSPAPAPTVVAPSTPMMNSAPGMPLMLSQGPVPHALAAAPALTATQLFDWAERLFPMWFPSHQPDLIWTTYVYRYYPETGNVVGVDGGVSVRVAGPSFGPNIVTVGVLSDFLCYVIPQACMPPTANAGAAMTVVAGSVVALDGSASSDPNHSALTFAWTLVAMPAGSSAVLAGAATAQPTFTADVAGTYEVDLVASNGYSSSPTASVVITATAGTYVPPGYNPY